MLLTNKKSVIELIGQDIVNEIADDYVYGTEEFNSSFPVVERLKEAWWEEVENTLSSFQLHDFMGRIDFETIAEQAIDQAENRYDNLLEAKSLDGWEYDGETGEYSEKRWV
jgi:hypothetical protein